MRSADEIAKAQMPAVWRDRATIYLDDLRNIIDAAQREAIEAAAKALGHLLHRAPDGVYATAVNDCHTAILALLPAPAREGEANA